MDNKRGFWNRIEVLLNKTPHLSILLLAGVILVAVVSGITASYVETISYTYINPETFEKSKYTLELVNYMEITNMSNFLVNVIKNFAAFDTMYLVIFTLFAFGVSEKSGFLYIVFKGLFKYIPNYVVTIILATLGVFSTMFVTDYLSGAYIILLPLSAFIFIGTDRNPLAGIALSFAAIFGGFAISFLYIGEIEVLSKITNIQMNSVVIQGAQDYFIIQIVLGVVFVLLTTWVTHNVIERNLPEYHAHLYTSSRLTILEKRGVILALLTTLLFIIGYLYLLLPPQLSSLPGFGSLVGEYDTTVKTYFDQFFTSVFIEGIIIHVTFYIIVVSSVYGLASHKFQNLQEVIKSMITSIADNAEYFILVFALSLFVAILYDSGLAIVIIQVLNNFAINNASDPIILIIITFLIGFIGTFFIPMSGLKWGLVAPIILPLFTAYSLHPVFGQTVYSFGESLANPISLIMPYTIFAYALFDSYAYKTKQQTGNGTYVKLTYPYVLSYMVVFIIIFIVWFVLTIPLSNTISIIM